MEGRAMTKLVEEVVFRRSKIEDVMTELLNKDKTSKALDVVFEEMNMTFEKTI
jgi:hypothetical protein